MKEGPQSVVIRCAKCGIRNRLTERVGAGKYKCARCGSEICSPFRYVVFDCETTGLPSGHADPYLVQLAWAVFSSYGTTIEAHNYIIRPEGFSIPQTATNVHGITDKEAKTFGFPLKLVIKNFLLSIKPKGTRLVAHNIAFDGRVLNAEINRLNIKSLFRDKPQFCTMRSTTSICKIPKRGKGYKWPSLQELHSHLFGRGFIGGHNAEEDVRATAACFFELMRKKLITFG